MKRKLFILMAVTCMAMSACGGEQEETVANNSVTENSIESTEQKAVQESTETQESVVESKEDVIGDVDITADGLTMEGMTEQIVGTEIPCVVIDAGSDASYADFKLLFPSPMYITEYHDNGVRAKTESIDFNITAKVQNDTPPEFVREEKNETMENIGNYVLVEKRGPNDKYGFQKTYYIYNTSNDTVLSCVLTINKQSEYQEYCDNLVNEFVPVFEETLLENLQ